MVKVILINSSNVSSPLKNEYTYSFIGGGLELPQDKKNQIAISSITIPYSFFNISDIYNNRYFNLIINGQTYTLELPPSFMTIDDLNKFIQWWFINNNLYCLDSFGNFVYFMEFEYNVSQYSVETVFYPMTLPEGGTNPKNVTLNGSTMQIQITQSQSGFGKLLGLLAGIYPNNPKTVVTSQISNTEVKGSEINALNMTCNLVNNSISTSPQTFYSFTPSNTSFGSNIVQNPSELIWVDTYSGRFQNLVIEIRDQENRQIHMRDSNICLMLCFRTINEE